MARRKNNQIKKQRLSVKMETINDIRKVLSEGCLKDFPLSRRKYLEDQLPDFRLENGELYFNKHRTVVKRIVNPELSLAELDNLITSSTPLVAEQYVLKETKLDKWLLVPKEEDIDDIITEAHVKNGHGGRDSVEKFVGENYYIPNFQSKFAAVKKNCGVCADSVEPNVVVLDNHYEFDWA